MKYAQLAAVFLLLLCFSGIASAEKTQQQEEIRRVTDLSGNYLFSFCGDLHEGDEYISAENMLYRIVSVEGDTATAESAGPETMPDVSWLNAGTAQPVFANQAIPVASDQSGAARLIAMYVTHSDESYIPTDGTESINGQGGIYDVARKFRDELQSHGIDVILDESTHLPHDSGAYRRSRQTAERLLQKRPDAIIDIHRDGIPDENEYTCTIDGENASQVRLLVGRSNQNSEVNREFAKEIKAVADAQYPGLIKDIFIGKGNYNQDLAPNAILLEFGTHTLSKERALESTALMADVMNKTLYGEQTGSAKAEKTATEESGRNTEKEKGAMNGIGWLILAVIIGAVAFVFVQTGSGKGMKNKLRRNISEISGGLLGKKEHTKDD